MEILISSFRSFYICTILVCCLRGAQNSPQSFEHQTDEYSSSLLPSTSGFINDLSFYKGQGTPFFGQDQSSLIRYGPQYFYLLGNNGLNAQCPAINTNCVQQKYRTFDGSCNNLINPGWGTANMPYGRLVRPKYADQIRQPTISVTGKPLPPARTLSVELFPDVKIDDNRFTLATMQWGQLITHDMSLASGSTLAEQRAGMCCGPDASSQGTLNYQNGPQECFPIEVPPNDPLSKNLGQQCMTFSRTRTDQQLGCPSKRKSAEQISVVSHWIDGSMVYGSDDQTAQSLRAFRKGKLLSEYRGGREWLPTNVNRSMVCEGLSQHGVGSCYAAGDIRVNQNTQLTVLQVLLLREHNRIAKKLAEMNPHWSDETVYQETRKIVIAEIQHITYYEWLPILLGYKNLLEHGIIYHSEHAYINDYNQHVDPSVLNEHATAAFRLFHTNIQGFLDLITENRYNHGSIRLSDHYNDPTVLEESNNFDDLTRGLSSQPQRATDKFHTSEITDFLFRNKQVIGFDLKAIDIQRGRDHGLASYNELREFCGSKRAHHFHDFLDFMEPEVIEKLQKLYAHPDDVELVVGGALEKLVPGTLSGPTYLCIMLEQFYRTRVADKYFYERGDHKGAFTPDQLIEIKKMSLARLMCDNGDNISSMQPRAFQLLSAKNPTVSCRDYQFIPFVNLEAWRDLHLNQKVYTSHLLSK
ncbi:hypothetical protein RUM44_005219 [Polyplax serrata]|uniref:Peroxidase n=1 Tax=Polyplax serrata TaxID=468196 RepID=A0ABR1AEF9_POLSC